MKERKFEFFLNSFIFNIEYSLKQIKKHGSRSETRSLPIFSIVKVSKLFPVLIPIIMTILDKFILYTANISNVISFYRWNAAESKQINPAVRITTNRLCLCLRPVTPPCVLTGPGIVHYIPIMRVWGNIEIMIIMTRAPRVQPKLLYWLLTW